MAITLHIRWDEGPVSIGSGKGRGEIKYVAISDDPASDGRDEVLQALTDNVPRDLFGLSLDEVRIGERISDADTGDPATRYAHWDCSATYINPQRKQPFPLYMELFDDPRPVRFTYKSGGGKTVNALRSELILEEAANEAVYRFKPHLDLNNALGWEFDKEDKISHFTAKGLPLPVGVTEIGCETVVHNDEVNLGWFLKAAKFAGDNACNENDWHGWPAYTMKMIGFTAEQRADKNASEGTNPQDNAELWDVNFTFEYKPDTEIDWDPIDPANRPQEEDPENPGSQRDRWLYGHEILDILYVPVTKTQADGSKITIDKVVRMAIHNFYPKGDFETELRI